MLTQKFSRSSNFTSLLMKTGFFITFLFLICFIGYKLAWSQPYDEAITKPASIQFNTVTYDDVNIHYAYAGNEEKPGIIFIHGTPGGWSAFQSYLLNQPLQDDFFIISVDRPGWGKSEIQNKNYIGNFEHQSRSIEAIFEHYPNKKWIVVGHSLGASLAPQIAMKSPESVSGLVLLAGSLKPKLGNPRWYNYAAQSWLVSKMVGNRMTKANREIMKLRKQLKIMNDSLKENKLNAHLVVIQGLKDKLVSPKNSAFAYQEWQDNFQSLEIIELEEAGHFLPWKNGNQVLKSIISMNDKINKDIALSN